VENINEFVVYISSSLIEDAANKKATVTRVPSGQVEVINSKVLCSPL
jgi:hypothetical protein